MDMNSRNQYIEQLSLEYLRASKKVKSALLDEAEKRTGMHRKHLIRKLSPEHLKQSKKPRKKKQVYYDGYAIAALEKIWKIFDYPCGQRLEPILKVETDRLRSLKELTCSNSVAKKLKQISPATIDRRLSKQKTELGLNRGRNPSSSPALYHKIPVKLSSEWDREEIGNVQLDYVCHCGSSAGGEFVHTLSGAEISLGWWEGAAIMGRSQKATKKGLDTIRKRYPFAIREIHPDNDSGMINDLIYRYCTESKIRMSRSRPGKKNDNAWVEQRNWTHIRKEVGYLRYDTKAELNLMNKLYLTLSLYKNFFQPTIKLVEKKRVGGKIHRKYEKHPKTPYRRLFKSGELDKKTAKKLSELYDSLNPAQLKRQIDQMRRQLVKLYEAKMRTSTANLKKKITPRLVTSLMIEPSSVR